MPGLESRRVSNAALANVALVLSLTNGEVFKMGGSVKTKPAVDTVRAHSPPHRGHRKKTLVGADVHDFGEEVHDPKGSRKILYMKSLVSLFSPKEGAWDDRLQREREHGGRTRLVTSRTTWQCRLTLYESLLVKMFQSEEDWCNTPPLACELEVR